MARCIFTSSRPDFAQKAALEASSKLNSRGVTVLGPAPAPISLLRSIHRWHLILTARERGPLHASLDCLERMQMPGGVRVKIDVDPYTML